MTTKGRFLVKPDKCTFIFFICKMFVQITICELYIGDEQPHYLFCFDSVFFFSNSAVFTFFILNNPHFVETPFAVNIKLNRRLSKRGGTLQLFLRKKTVVRIGANTLNRLQTSCYFIQRISNANFFLNISIIANIYSFN